MSTKPPIQYSGPKISEEVGWETRRHLQLLYQKLGNHTQAFQLQAEQIAKLKGGSTTTNITEIAGGSSPVPPASGFPGQGLINDQSGATGYATAPGDNGILLVFNNASPVAVTLTTDAAPFYLIITNFGAGTATLTPSTGTINGGASLALLQNQTVYVACDSTNWHTTAIPVSPQNTPAVAHEFLTAFNASTGAFTQTALVASDIPNIAESQVTNLVSDLAAKAAIASVQQEAYIYAADTGAANAYAVSLTPAPTIVAGSVVVFKAANANTGASTLAVNGGTATAIKKNGSTALASGDIATGQIITVVYDGTNWQMVGGPGGGGSITLQTDGTNNSSQTLQNLAHGPGITLADLGGGKIQIEANANSIRLLQSTSGHITTGTSVTIAFPSAITAGSAILVEFSTTAATSVSGVSDTLANSYTAYNNYLPGSFMEAVVYVALNSAAGSNSVTVTAPAGAGNVNIYEYSNVASIVGSNYGANISGVGAGTSIGTGNVTSTAFGDMMHLTVAGRGGAGLTVGNSNNYNAIQSNNGDTVTTLGGFYLQQQSSGTVSATGTQSSNTNGIYAGLIVLRPYVAPRLSLTTTGTSGAATYNSASGVLNVPNYSSGGGGGNYTLLETHTASGSTTEIDFTASISGSYKVYVVEIIDFNIATNSAVPRIQFSTNGGSTYDTSSIYDWSHVNCGFSSGGSGSNKQTNVSGITIFGDSSGGGLLNTATPALACTFHIYDPLNTSNYKYVKGGGIAVYTGGDTYHFDFGGRYRNTAAQNAFRIILSAGNISSGSIVSCYGIS